MPRGDSGAQGMNNDMYRPALNQKLRIHSEKLEFTLIAF
jgi:hypothetical protein